MRFSRWCLLSAFGFLAFHSSAALARHGTANASHAQRENAILVVTPMLAAWAPNLLFGAGAAYLLLTVRT